jgi:hypothetical protein
LSLAFLFRNLFQTGTLSSFSHLGLLRNSACMGRANPAL